MKRSREKAAAILFVLFVLAALAIRITYTTSRYDETFNLWVSAATVLGQKHLVENPYIFQTGDLWNLPFIALFYHLTGDFQGLVLFVRFCYLLLNITLAFITWKLLKNAEKRLPVVLLVMLIPTFAFASIYSMSYDTAFLYFVTLGTVLFTAAMIKAKKSPRQSMMLRFLAGVSYACMVYAYPTMVIVLPVLFVTTGIWIARNTGGKQARIMLAGVAAGGLVVLAVFLVYLCSVGCENTILAQGLSTSLMSEGRPMGDIAGSQDGLLAMMWKLLVQVIFNIARSCWFLLKWNAGLWVLTIVFLLQWVVGLKTGNSVIRCALLFEISVVAFLAQLKNSYLDYFDNLYAYAYYFFWTPFVFLYIEDAGFRSKAGWLISVASIPALGGFAAVANTALYSVKAAEGLYLGAVVAIVLFCMALYDNLPRRLSKGMWLSLLAGGIVLLNLGTFYLNPYEGEPFYNCSIRIESGILKGIRVGTLDAQYESFEKAASAAVGDEVETVYCSQPLIGGYFWTESFPGSLPSSQTPSEEWADLLILSEEEYAYSSETPGYEVLYEMENCVIMKKGETHGSNQKEP